ncbi:MAG: hypothetical protein M1822_005675 [Bathelium mastoideum]|nr:MAG: hypothetical protein M1822_005675 [Bathelium mastoideum]
MKTPDLYQYQDIRPRRRTPVFPMWLLIGAASVFLWELMLFVTGTELSARLFQNPLSRWYANITVAKSSGDFEWSNLPVLNDLQYTPCFEDLQCARLRLPLDWWNGTTSESISLAIVKLPAKVPVTDRRYGGPILINPGGPGGSGVQIVRGRGPQLQTIVDHPDHPYQTLDDDSAKYFDILSFDPRGIGASEPAMHCFPDESTSQTWALRLGGEGIINSSDAALGRLWSMTHAEGASCAANRKEHDIKIYGSTASVARDMLEIVERHGQWRDLEVRKELHQTSCRIPVSQDLPSHVQNLRYRPNEEKLLYWGFSYGTFLGSTFAAMFPDRVERLILDGVVDAPDYLKTLWTDNLVSTERAVQSFYDLCAAAGPDKCDLATQDDQPADIKAKLDGILAKLRHNPLQVVGKLPEVVEWSDVKDLVFTSLYTPVQSFPFLAKILAAVERSNGTDFAKLLRPLHSVTCPSRSTDRASMNSWIGKDSAATVAIACGDGDPVTDMTLEAFDAYWQQLQSLSPTVGAIWSEMRMMCSAWGIRPLYRFTGPYKANTSHPILWIGNTADPVTPLQS